MRFDILTIGRIDDELMAVNRQLLLEQASDVDNVDRSVAVLGTDFANGQRLSDWEARLLVGP